MKSQQQFINHGRQFMGDLFLCQNFYRSTFVGELGKSDVEAKKKLSNYSYQMFYKKSLRLSYTYQTKMCNLGTHQIVWKYGEVLDVDNFIVIQKGEQCMQI